MQNQYMMIQNNGEIDLKAFFVMGVTSKTEEDKSIGQFGTGTKYGIAALIREGYPITIFSGVTQISFSTRKIVFRGQEHNEIVYRKGKTTYKTGITAEMGKLNWNAARGYRELVSNAIDEGGFSTGLTTELCGEAGTTRVFIQYKNLQQKLDDDFDKYFLINRTPLYSNDVCAVYPKHGDGTRVYRRGILVACYDKLGSVYDYDLRNVPVSEDRVSGLYDIETSFTKIINNFPIDIRKSIIPAFGNKDFLEARLHAFYGRPDSEWVEIMNDVLVTVEELPIVFKRLKANNTQFTVVTGDVRSYMKMSSGFKTAEDVIGGGTLAGWETTEIDQYEETVIEEAISFLNLMGIKLTRSEVHVANNSSDNVVYGQFIDGKIYIDKKTIERGLDDTIDTLFEEASHRDSGAEDESREFQEFLKKKCLHYMRRLQMIQHAKKAVRSED